MTKFSTKLAGSWVFREYELEFLLDGLILVKGEKYLGCERCNLSRVASINYTRPVVGGAQAQFSFIHLDRITAGG